MPTKFATKSQLEYLRRATSKKLKLSELDTILLLVVSFIGILFSVIQALPGDWNKFLAFFPLLIVGWVFPLLIYVYRVVHKLSLKKSLISHFRSWAYFGYSLIGYITISIALHLEMNTVRGIIVTMGVLASLILFTIAILRIWANRLFTSLFRYGSVPSINIIFPNILAIAVMCLFSLSYSFFYLGYLLYIYQLLLNLVVVLIIAGSTLFILSFIILGHSENMIGKRKMIYVSIFAYVILGLMSLSAYLL